MSMSQEHPPLSLVEDVEAAFGSSEAYETLFGLPEDEALLEVFEAFSQETTTLAFGNLITPTIVGLPTCVTDNWNKAEDVYRDLDGDQLLETPVGLGMNELVSIPAYGLEFETGIYDSPGEEPHVVIKLREPSSGIGIAIRRIVNVGDRPYKIYSDSDHEIGDLDDIEMVNLLASLAGLDTLPDGTFTDAETFRRLVQYTGQKFGVSSNQYKITTRLLDSHSPEAANSYGAVLFREDETPEGSSKSFVIERHLIYDALDADEVLRMKASFVTVDSAHQDDSNDTLRLGKTVLCPASYDVKNISIEHGLAGTEKPVELTDASISAVMDTLQEVVGSTSESLT